MLVCAVTGVRVLTVSSDDVVAEVTAQACLQAGLSAIFTDLLDFDGDEIYFADVAPALVGQTYREAVVSYEACSVLGVLSDRSEEHTSELQSLMRISYAVFCLKKKTITTHTHTHTTPNKIV